MQLAVWTPEKGDIVHLNRRNRWQLPAGRYQIERGAGVFWHLRGVTNGECQRGIPMPHLVDEEAKANVTAITPDELDRERQEVELRAAAPLRGNRKGVMRRQHDASDLALFRAANEPAFL